MQSDMSDGRAVGQTDARTDRGVFLKKDGRHQCSNYEVSSPTVESMSADVATMKKEREDFLKWRQLEAEKHYPG